MWSFKVESDSMDTDKQECSDILKSLAKNIDNLGPDGQYVVGYSYLVRPSPDSAIGIASIEKAARRGLTLAQEELGRLFFEGSEVPKDYVRAAEWYREFVKSTRTPTGRTFTSVRQASERLGYLYSGVSGIPTDDQESARWFLRAAEMGSAYAQRSIAFRCRDGQGVQKSLPEMVRWFRRAAEQGDVESQNKLGGALYIGIGVPQDYVHAHMWFNLAAASGNAQAAMGRDAVAAYMSPEQIGEAQALAANWRPRPDPADITAPREIQ
jgi:TPR repeat protein